LASGKNISRRNNIILTLSLKPLLISDKFFGDCSCTSTGQGMSNIQTADLPSADLVKANHPEK